MSDRFEPVQRLAVLGLGLLGGSVAWAARERGLAREVVGCGRREAPLRDAVHALAAEGALSHVTVDDPAVCWDMNTPQDHAARVAAWLARRNRSPG